MAGIGSPWEGLERQVEIPDIEGRCLQATDLDWSYGSGPVLRGPAEYLALVLCGRTVPEGRLEGKPL